VDIFLASNSPRRKELLGLTDLVFRVAPAHIDETPETGENADAYVRRLAIAKVNAASKTIQAGIVIAADTTVALNQSDGEVILGKPVDSQDARCLLDLLRSKTHRVITGLAVIDRGRDLMRIDCCVTEVLMRNYTDKEMRIYIDSGDAMDKAGAYAIQHKGFHPVKEVTGCYANVMGLPLCHLSRLLSKFEIQLTVDIAHACQCFLDYDCQVYREVLAGTY
jgi:septum formation protein